MSKPNGRKKHWGSRSLLWAAGLFCVAQLTANLLIDGYWPQLRSNFFPWLVPLIHQAPRGPDVLGVGTSRLEVAFDSAKIQLQMQKTTDRPALFVFNASIPALDYTAANFVLDQFLHDRKTPAIMVLEVCPELVAVRNHWLGEHILPRPTWNNLGLYAEALYLDLRHLPGLMRERLWPLSRCRRNIRAELLAAWQRTLCPPPPPADAPADVDAPAPSKVGEPMMVSVAALGGSKSSAEDPTAAVRAINMAPTRPGRVEVGLQFLRPWLRDYRVGGLSTIELERLLDRCRQNRIRVILVAPPCCTEQRQLYTPAIEKPYRAYLDQLAQRYPCSYVDYRALLPDEMLEDNHHVTVEGAEVFSRKLTEDVLLPAYRARQLRPGP